MFNTKLFENNASLTGEIIAKKLLKENSMIERRKLIIRTLNAHDKAILKSITESFSNQGKTLTGRQTAILHEAEKLLQCSEEMANKALSKCLNCYLINKDYRFNPSDYDVLIEKPDDFCQLTLDLLKFIKEHELLQKICREYSSIIEDKFLDDNLNREKSFCLIM